MESKESGVCMEYDNLQGTTTTYINVIVPDVSQRGNQNFCVLKSSPFQQISYPNLKNAVVTNRTQLKQQLEREHVHQQEKRETRLASIAEDSTTIADVQSSAQHLPIQIILPNDILNVATPLQNPTRYHVNAIMEYKAKQFILGNLQDQANKSLVYSDASEFSDVASHSDHSDVGHSFLQKDTLAEYTNYETEMTDKQTRDIEKNELLEDLLSFEEEQNDGQLAVDQGVTERLKPFCGTRIETAEEKKRRKKDSHNIAERRSRNRKKQLLETIDKLLPRENSSSQKRTEGALYEDIIQYIISHNSKEESQRDKSQEMDKQQNTQLIVANCNLEEECKLLKNELDNIRAKAEVADTEKKSLQLKLQSQENEFYLQNQALLQKLLILELTNEKLERDLAALQNGGEQNSTSVDHYCKKKGDEMNHQMYDDDDILNEDPMLLAFPNELNEDFCNEFQINN